MNKILFKYLLSILLFAVAGFRAIYEFFTFQTLNIMTFWILLLALMFTAFSYFKTRTKKIISVSIIASVFLVSLCCACISYRMVYSEQLFASATAYFKVIKGDALYYVIPFRPVSPLYRSNKEIFICKKNLSKKMLIDILTDYYPTLTIHSLEKVNDINNVQQYEITFDSNKHSYFYVTDKETYTVFSF